MTYREFQPPSPLRPWVRCIWVKSGRAPGEQRSVHRVLPDGCADIIFDLGDPPATGSGEVAYAVGTMTRAILVERTGRLDYLGVRFEPGRALPFLGVGLDEITDHQVALADLWGPDAGRWEDGVATASGTRARLATLHDLLLERLRSADGPDPDPTVDRAVERLEGTAGHTAIGVMADVLGISRQHLTRSFRRRVGIPPKLFARVVRLEAALKEARSSGEPEWVRIAHETGYADQSHLIHDCRELAGASPTEVVGDD